MRPFPNYSHRIAIALGILATLLAACSAPKSLEDYAMATPLPTPTLGPYLGQVGQRVVYYGWAIQVENVVRSSLDPTEDRPDTAIPRERDYIGMDVTLERLAEERVYISGDEFTLQDSAGNVYTEDPFIEAWQSNIDFFAGTTRTNRVVIPVPRTAQGLKLVFTPGRDAPGPLEVALDQVNPPRHITLREAVELGLITANVRGVSLENIVVEVSLEADDSFEVLIEPGTAFLAPSPDLQTMIVREGLSFYIADDDELSINVEVACANMRLEAPSGGEVYIVQIEPPAEELRKLLGLPEFQQSSFRLQQFAIWTITDKPGRGGYVGLGVGSEGSPPASNELKTIAAWFEKAGLVISDYPSLR